MAVNEALNALSTTDGSNTPNDADVIGSTLDDELRSIKANIARAAREEYTATQSVAFAVAVTGLNKIFPVGAATTVTASLVTAAAALDGFRVTFVNVGSSEVLLDGHSAETINGATTYSLRSLYDRATVVCDGSNWHLVNGPARTQEVRAIYYLTSNQSLADNTIADVTGWTKVTDLGDDFNSTTGVFTAPVDGTYLITGNGVIDVTGDDTEQFQISITNGADTTYARSDVTPGAGALGRDPGVSISVIIEMAATETYKMRAVQRTSAARNLLAGLSNTNMQIVRIA